jgi:hypothetical protein
MWGALGCGTSSACCARLGDDVGRVTVSNAHLPGVLTRKLRNKFLLLLLQLWVSNMMRQLITMLNAEAVLWLLVL